MTESVHVHPSRFGRWAVRRHNSSRATRVFDDVRNATAFGRRLAREGKANLYIHRRDGMVARVFNYA
jgi:hypothetical protein